MDGGLIIWPPVRRRPGQSYDSTTDGPSKDPPHLHYYRKDGEEDEGVGEGKKRQELIPLIF